MHSSCIAVVWLASLADQRFQHHFGFSNGNYNNVKPIQMLRLSHLRCAPDAAAAAAAANAIAIAVVICAVAVACFFFIFGLTRWFGRVLYYSHICATTRFNGSEFMQTVYQRCNVIKRYT